MASIRVNQIVVVLCLYISSYLLPVLAIDGINQDIENFEMIEVIQNLKCSGNITENNAL